MCQVTRNAIHTHVEYNEHYIIFNYEFDFNIVILKLIYILRSYNRYRWVAQLQLNYHNNY